MFSRKIVENVGIIAMEVYYPTHCISQSLLEQHDKVLTGKYTVGLGQETLAFCDDLEDINSICLTAVSNLMTKYKINYEEIGRLEVGTETIIDHSKSVKTCLMQLFKESGNANVEGVDSINACYGGTQALFNSLAWVESSAYDGRYALVVCGDIAVYAEGPARPSGGAGCVAMLIGPFAPIVVRSKERVSYFKHVYDFYKPELNSEYPIVDGLLSIQCYLEAIDANYQQYEKKKNSTEVQSEFNLEVMADFYCFHSPYTKLVRKSFARMLFNDFINDKDNLKFSSIKSSMLNKTLENTYFCKETEQTFLQLSTKQFNNKVEPSLLLAKHLGNTYTASLYCGLISLLSEKGLDLIGQTSCLFSYGSGFASSFFLVEFRDPSALIYSHFQDLKEELKNRKFVDGETFSSIMKLRENVHQSMNYKPIGDVNNLKKGTYYLSRIDDKYRRFYDIKQ